jgi:N-acetylated-alpha-linked acidic dipeptidase
MNRLLLGLAVPAVIAGCAANLPDVALPSTPLSTVACPPAPLGPSSATPAGDGSPTLAGYAPSSVAAELAWEGKLRAIPSPDRMRDAMRRLTARPHHVGSPYDKDNAEWILARFKEAGLDAHIEEFSVLYPTPKRRLLEMVAPVTFTARLQEPAVKGDSTSGQVDEQLPTYNAYSIDGDVTAPLVYANYGQIKDYEDLDRLGVSVKGAIVITRYGESWRGVKPKLAAEHGAVGCIIYSDPRDDGYGIDDVYPGGPARGASSVQRGSVFDMPAAWPGDPLTPGVGATPSAKRLPMSEAKSLTKIPVLPISYGDAQPLLAQLRGPMAPEKARGGLPIPYHVGPGPARVHLVVQSSWDQKPVYDVIGKVAGTSAADTWILRGNHHDAWVNGASDPVSGQVAMLEEVRAVGELLEQGWRPRRTLVFAAWDGEEAGLLGSTEWAEAHADELGQHAAVYVNTDNNGRGLLHAGGSHTLERAVNAVAREVEDPETKLTVFARRRLAAIAHADSPEDRAEIRDRADTRLATLGSGSDFAAFLDHLGIASLNLSFDGEDDEGQYHSIYDDFAWFTHFADTDFAYGRALAQTAGTLLLRLADAEVLPIEFTAFADQMAKYQRDLEKQLKKRQDELRESHKQLDEGVFRATFDPRRPTVPPPREEVPPFIDFAPLENAIESLKESAKREEKAMALLAPHAGDPAMANLLVSVNEKLAQSERRLMSDAGLLRRPWYRHMIYAPGIYSGYAARPMPGVAEGIEQKHYAEAEAEVKRVAAVLRAEVELVDSISAAVEARVK